MSSATISWVNVLCIQRNIVKEDPFSHIWCSFFGEPGSSNDTNVLD